MRIRVLSTDAVNILTSDPRLEYKKPFKGRGTGFKVFGGRP